MAECIENIVIPTLAIDYCKGKKISTKCVFNESAFTLLNLPINSSLDVILDKLVASLVSQQAMLVLQTTTIASMQIEIINLKNLLGLPR